MSEHQKMAILSNELVRRLSTIHREVLEEEIHEVIEHYTTQLKTSGYSRKQTKEIIVCGIVGWRRKLERRQKKNQKEYLDAKETLEKRTDAKLLERSNWYKENLKRKIEDKESQYQYHPPSKKRRGKSSKEIKTDKPDGASKVK